VPKLTRHRLRVAIAGFACLAGLALPSAAGAVGEPVNTSVPVISGQTADGAVLSASRGGWSSLLPISGYSYRWIRCGAGCANIPGATAATYKLTPADVGALIQVRVGATNALGTGYGYSAKVGPVQSIPPAFASGGVPTVFGTAREGETLTGSDGFWSGTPPISVAGRGWVRCDINGEACSEPVSGGDTRKLGADDVGHTIRYRVDIQGPQYGATGLSAATEVVAAKPSDPGDPPGGGGGGGEPDEPTTPSGARLLRPFPTVLMAGRVFPVGARVTKFVVRGPNGARVAVRCRGRTCPVHKLNRRIKRGKARLGRLETNLLFGTTIVVRVTQAGRIGKYTRIRIRHGQAPARSDLCLRPGESKPNRCPKGAA
jgi:hypothetical protein